MQKNIIRAVVFAAAVLLIPLIAMQFTEQVQWTPFDFIFMGSLLSMTAYSFLWFKSQSNDLMHRLGVGLGVMTGFLLVWSNAAVGIIGDDNPVNMLYILVAAIAFFGAILSRFRPQGLARVMFTTAFAQALVPVIALVVIKMLNVIPASEVNWVTGMDVLKTFVLNTGFVMMFIGSGLLFQRAQTKTVQLN